MQSLFESNTLFDSMWYATQYDGPMERDPGNVTSLKTEYLDGLNVQVASLIWYYCGMVLALHPHFLKC